MDGVFTDTGGEVKSAETTSVLDRVVPLLGPFNRHSIELTRDTDIAQGLEVDSVAIFDVIMDVEDSYDITFPMEAIGDIKTVGDLTDMIETLR